VCPKRFPCPWYIRHKPCTFLAPRLKPSPNISKWASVCSTSPRSTIRCEQNDFWAYGMFGPNRAPTLRQDYISKCCKWVSTWPTSRRSTIGCAPIWFMNLWYVQRKLCTNLMSRLTLSPNRLKWSSSQSTLPRITIWCAQSNFRAYGIFGANVQLFYLEINTISNRTEMSFHLTNVT
jgi:hypothetical protein